uniref:Uncharacterized protein n=1 Tax=Echeneis naucrates TaxID=173247 RepID=A0A665VUW0_ECHNA
MLQRAGGSLGVGGLLLLAAFSTSIQILWLQRRITRETLWMDPEPGRLWFVCLFTAPRLSLRIVVGMPSVLNCK